LSTLNIVDQFLTKILKEKKIKEKNSYLTKSLKRGILDFKGIRNDKKFRMPQKPH